MPRREFTLADDRALFGLLNQLTTAKLAVLIAFLLIRDRADRDTLIQYLRAVAQ
jgi:hypothetical protein